MRPRPYVGVRQAEQKAGEADSSSRGHSGHRVESVVEAAGHAVLSPELLTSFCPRTVDLPRQSNHSIRWRCWEASGGFWSFHIKIWLSFWCAADLGTRGKRVRVKVTIRVREEVSVRVRGLQGEGQGQGQGQGKDQSCNGLRLWRVRIRYMSHFQLLPLACVFKHCFSRIIVP